MNCRAVADMEIDYWAYENRNHLDPETQAGNRQTKGKETMTNIDLIEICGADVEYMDECSVMAIESLPADLWPVIVAACEDLTGGDGPGIDCEISVTHETIADFIDSSKGYRELGDKKSIQIKGKDALKMTGIQFHKYDCRINMVVLDCGTRRVVLSQ